MQQYFIDESHSTMKSIDGVIYSKDGSELIAYPIGRKNDYSVVEGTKVIKKGALIINIFFLLKCILSVFTFPSFT